LPEPDPNRHHVNELDRLRRQMRLKDILDMINKLEHLKLHAKSSKEIINTLEDIKENLEYLEAEVKRKKKRFFFFIQLKIKFFSHKILFRMSLSGYYQMVNVMHIIVYQQMKYFIQQMLIVVVVFVEKFKQ
jgi:predicted RNase H-like nuclease (RuvC/YqgF family)